MQISRIRLSDKNSRFRVQRLLQFSDHLSELIGFPISRVLPYVLRLSWTEVPSLHQSYPASAVLRTSPPPQGAQPVPRGLPVGHCWPRHGASRVAYAFLVYMLSPLPRRSGWAYSSLCFTQPYQPSPKGLSGRPAHCPFRGLLSVHSRYGLHTRAVTNSWHANRRLQPLRYLHDCSDCFRLERLPGGACTHWKAPPCHGAHPLRTRLPVYITAFL